MLEQVHIRLIQFSWFGFQGINNGANLLITIANKLYSNTTLGAIATNLSLDDINEVSSYTKEYGLNRAYYLGDDSSYVDDVVEINGIEYTNTQHSEYYAVGYTEPRFYLISGIEIDGGEDVNDSYGTYKTPKNNNPVYVKSKGYHSNGTVAWNHFENDNFTEETYASLVSNALPIWLVSDIEYYPGATYGSAGFPICNSNGVFGCGFVSSYCAPSGGPQMHICPIVSIPSSVLIDTTDSTKDGSSASNAWVIEQ